MYSTNRSTRHGTRLFVSTIAAVLATAWLPAAAETVATINGTPIDSTVLDVYIQSRTNRPAAEMPAQDRRAVLSELTDIYLLSTQESAAEIEKKPIVSAQLELQRHAILAQAVAAEFYAGVQIEEAEILAEYENQIKLAPNQQFKARHILVASQGEAVEIIEALIGGGDFVELAKERSTGPSGPNGGDLGWFGPDQMVKPFSDAVARLEDGRYTTDPVQTQFGWHVILREDSRAAEPPTLESARENISQVIQTRKFQEYLAELRTQAAE